MPEPAKRAERAFPVIYAQDVQRSVRFYQRLGFEPHVQLPPEGDPGYVGLRRGAYELAIVTTQSPEQLIGLKVGEDPRFELFAYVTDPDGNPVALASEGRPIA